MLGGGKFKPNLKNEDHTPSYRYVNVFIINANQRCRSMVAARVVLCSSLFLFRFCLRGRLPDKPFRSAIVDTIDLVAPEPAASNPALGKICACSVVTRCGQRTWTPNSSESPGRSSWRRRSQCGSIRLTRMESGRKKMVSQTERNYWCSTSGKRGGSYADRFTLRVADRRLATFSCHAPAIVVAFCTWGAAS
jgi:hypothetical protein